MQLQWLVTKWPSPAHAPTPPKGGTPCHRKGDHNHITTAVLSRAKVPNLWFTYPW
ncbi:hypothetical protein AVEN_206943-1, partial [Araneus ventricosus]